MRIKKSVFVASLLACSLVFGSIGAVASTGVEKISASLNHNIKFLLNGKKWTPTDANGKELSALVYKGSTYVPLRAVSNALGAAVDYDANNLVITIDNSDDGIPYLDSSSSSGSSNGSNSNAGNSSGSGSSNITTPAANESKGKLTFSSSFNAEKEAEGSAMKQEAVALVKMYGEALATGNTSKFNAYVKEKATDSNPDALFMGHKYSLDKFSEQINGLREANDSKTISEYSAAMKAVKASDLTPTSVYQGDYSATIGYSFYPEGWNAYSSVYLYFQFSVLKDGSYTLNYLYFS